MLQNRPLLKTMIMMAVASASLNVFQHFKLLCNNLPNEFLSLRTVPVEKVSRGDHPKNIEHQILHIPSGVQDGDQNVDSVSNHNKKDVSVNTTHTSLRIGAKSTSASNDVEILPDNKKKGAAIAFLISNSRKDTKDFKRAMASLDEHMNHDLMSAPVLLFNEGNLDEKQMHTIRNATTRPVHFPVVDFQQFPKGFNPDTEESNWKKRSRWGYQQMCRFWATKIWEHPILNDYSTYMRFDADSCFTKGLAQYAYLPSLPTETQHVYAANEFRTERPRFIVGLHKLAEEYVIANNITVKNPELFEAVGKKRTIIYNNFEISNITFFRQADVMAFQRAITEMEPFGVFRKRWGDAPIRTLTLAIFADASQVLWNVTKSKGYEHPCRVPHDKVRNAAAVKKEVLAQKNVDRCSSRDIKTGGEIVLKGERHSGTNWIRKIIWQNLKENSMKIEMDSEAFGWKHGKLYPDGWGKPLSQNEVLVVVTRDVFTWLPKMFEQAYDPIMNRKRGDGFSSYIRAPYGGICQPRKAKACKEINKSGSQYETAENLIQARTQKYKQWLSNAPNNSTYSSSEEIFLQNRIHVRLESLTAYQDGENDENDVTAKELQRTIIGDPLSKLCVPMNDNFNEVTTHTNQWAAEQGGNVIDQKKRRNKVDVKQETMKLLSIYSKEDLGFVLSQLDLKFEKKLGYDYSYVFDMLNEDETSSAEKVMVSDHDEIDDEVRRRSTNVYLKNNS